MWMLREETRDLLLGGILTPVIAIVVGSETTSGAIYVASHALCGKPVVPRLRLQLIVVFRCSMGCSLLDTSAAIDCRQRHTDGCRTILILLHHGALASTPVVSQDIFCRRHCVSTDCIPTGHR